jgi:hypothetical protein
MEPGGSLSNLQASTTCLYPKPDQSSLRLPPFHSFSIRFNIMLPFPPRFSKCFLSLRPPHQNPLLSPIRVTCRPVSSHIILTAIGLFVFEKKIYIFLCFSTKPWVCYYTYCLYYRGADKSLARPTARCILFDGENISYDVSLVIYINSTNIPPIMIIFRI